MNITNRKERKREKLHMEYTTCCQRVYVSYYLRNRNQNLQVRGFAYFYVKQKEYVDYR